VFFIKMGNLYSSLPVVNPARSGNYEEVEEDDCSSNPSTPFPEAAGATEGKLRALTALIDPRSPTVGVSRTPVEVIVMKSRSLWSKLSSRRSQLVILVVVVVLA